MKPSRRVWREIRQELRGKMAKELDIPEGSLKRIVKEDVGLNPYKFQRRKLLSSVLKSKQLDIVYKIIMEMQCKAFNYRDNRVCAIYVGNITGGVWTDISPTETCWCHGLGYTCFWSFEINAGVYWRSEKEKKFTCSCWREMCCHDYQSCLHSRRRSRTHGQYDA